MLRLLSALLRTLTPGLLALCHLGVAQAVAQAAPPGASTKQTNNAASSSSDETAAKKKQSSIVSGGRPWTVRDSVAVRYFVNSQTYPSSIGASINSNPIIPSHDRRSFFFVTRRGNLECDCNVYELAVFSVSEVSRILRDPAKAQQNVAEPSHLLTFCAGRSGESEQPISRASWENNGSIVFRGVHADGLRQLYRFSVGTGLLTRLSRDEHDVTDIFATRGNAVVYVARGEKRQGNALNSYPMTVITGWKELGELTSPDERIYTIFASADGRDVWPIGSYVAKAEFDAFNQVDPWLSPDRNWAIVVFSPADAAVPESWNQYKGSGDARRLRPRFVIADLRAKRSWPVLNAPTGMAVSTAMSSKGRNGWSLLSPLVLWTLDSKRAILVNTALPLTSNQDERSAMAYIVDYEVHTGRWSVIEPLASARGRSDVPTRPSEEAQYVTQVGWLQEGKEFLVTHATSEGTPLDGAAYRLVKGKWLRRSVPSSMQLKSEDGRHWVVSPRQGRENSYAEGLSVALRESANEPPIAVASLGDRTIKLLEPDSALKDVWRAEVQEVTWTEPSGHTAIGGLMLPRDFNKDRPVPLVIQSYYWVPHRFLPDGTSSTAYAAQPLVSRGMAVLFLNLPSVDMEHVKGTPREFSSFVDRIDAAVDALVHKGIVDISRIGLVGFSRAGGMTYHAITNPGRTKLAAAVVADSGMATFGEYLISSISSNGSDGRGEFERLYGGGSFWENKEAWLERAPSFNVDRVTTPVLFAYNGKGTAIYAFETLGAFRLNRRPIEYLLFPAGAHQLIRPKEREASLQATVDWMSFWLQGYENPSGPLERYERWRKMHDWHMARLREPRAHGVAPQDLGQQGH